MVDRRKKAQNRWSCKRIFKWRKRMVYRDWERRLLVGGILEFLQEGKAGGEEIEILLGIVRVAGDGGFAGEEGGVEDVTGIVEGMHRGLGDGGFTEREGSF